MRSKNSLKTRIDYDLNIFSPEKYDPNVNRSYYEDDDWWCHVYIYSENSHKECGQAFRLSIMDIVNLDLNNPKRWSVDSWYGVDGFLRDFWNNISDELRYRLESLPKYEEDK